MAADQVRQASKALSPPLRWRGTSPVLGSTLRQALAALDKSLTGLDGQKQEEVIPAGMSQLRTCVKLRVRTGTPLPTPFPALATADVRARLLSGLETHFAKLSGRLKPGDWCYQGKPARVAAS